MRKLVREKIDLETIADEDLLSMRISDLPVKIEGTWLQGCVEQLYQELEDKGLSFRPKCYLADEWLTPQHETCIGIPFYLAHPTLIQLEKKFMIDAEGEGKHWCMKLLRHEAGHALCYAYNLHRRKSWQNVFGPSTLEYTDTYKYRPYSKNYVRHLDGYYAQYHPEEDFVETFAVWLTPEIDWHLQYKSWKALRKLQYVDKLMEDIQSKGPVVQSSRKYWRVSTLRKTLQNYYKKKRKLLEEEFPDFHDRFLRKNFVERNGNSLKAVGASMIIRKYQRSILNNVSRSTGEKKYLVNDLLKGIQRRSRELNLIVKEEETVVVLNLCIYVTSLIMNYSYTGRFQGEKSKRDRK